MTNYIFPKPALTFEDQLTHLKNKGLIVTDDKKALKVLKSTGYYRLRGYSIPFMTKNNKKEEKFKDGVTFEQIYRTCEFDRELREILFKLIYDIEVKLRVSVSYNLGHELGALGYKKLSNFPKHVDCAVSDNNCSHSRKNLCIFFNKCNFGKYKIFLLNHEKEIEFSSNDIIVLHHNREHQGNLPIWAAVQIMSFGTLSKLVSSVAPKEVKLIINSYTRMSVGEFHNYLHTTSLLRNTVCHHSRLFDKHFVPRVRIPKSDESLCREKNFRFLINNQNLFAYLLAAKRISPLESWQAFVADLGDLLSFFKSVDLTRMNFPTFWYDILYS